MSAVIIVVAPFARHIRIQADDDALPSEVSPERQNGLLKSGRQNRYGILGDDGKWEFNGSSIGLVPQTRLGHLRADSKIVHNTGNGRIRTIRGAPGSERFEQRPIT